MLHSIVWGHCVVRWCSSIARGTRGRGDSGQATQLGNVGDTWRRTMQRLMDSNPRHLILTTLVFLSATANINTRYLCIPNPIHTGRGNST